MARFFVTPDAVSDGYITLTGTDAAHISLSLRMKPGEIITVCDSKTNLYECELSSLSKQTVTAKIISVTVCSSELPVRVHLFQSLPKGDKMELILQKATELGVYSVTPVISERCVSRPDAASLEKKRIRYGTICREAAMQSGRGVIPEVRGAMTFKNAVDSVPDSYLRLFCYEGEGTVPLGKAAANSAAADIAVFIGPEGGYPVSETSYAGEAGFILTGLGKRILRCETAPLLVLSSLVFQYELI